MTARRHARQAALPPAGYARPRPIDESGLIVTVFGEGGGVEDTYDFGALLGPRDLLVACAAGFERLAGPDRSWRAAATCENGYRAIRTFLRYAATLRTGDVPLANTADGHRRMLARYVRALGGRDPEQTWGRLFLTLPEALALTVLFVCAEGWNWSVLDKLCVPDESPAEGDDDLAIYRVEIRKRRRPPHLRYTSNNLVDDGPGSPGRLMHQALEATEPARLTLAMLGEPTGRLLISRRGYDSAKYGLFHLGAPPRMVAMRSWVESSGLIGNDPGNPFRVSLRRLRRTVQVLVRKEPAQNTDETHQSVYVRRDPAAQREAQEVAAQGLANAVEHARTVMKMRMLLDAGADELTDYVDDAEKAQALVDGVLDTATGACLDFRNSPFAEPGEPCTASFLNCLACRNAVATRRHLPRLAYLHHALNALRATLDPAVWDQDWREHFLRLTSLLEDNTSPPEREAALRAASDADRDLIDRMLHREYDA